MVVGPDVIQSMLRQGSFFPVRLQRRRRIDQALHAVVMEAWVKGGSTRAVDDLVDALGIGSGISKSKVSRGRGVEQVAGVIASLL